MKDKAIEGKSQEQEGVLELETNKQKRIKKIKEK